MTDEQLPATIPGLVARAAASFATREALVDERARLTFAQLAEQVDRAGRALVASGIEPGDRVGIWAPNCTEWVIAALGISAAGGAIVPLEHPLQGRARRATCSSAPT